MKGLNPSRFLELTDPVTWLIKNAGWGPFPYEAEILQDHNLRIRVIHKSRQIGITTTISHEAAWKAATTPNRLILIVSPSLRQSKVPMDRIHALVDTIPELDHQTIRKNSTEIAFRNGSRILSLPNNPDRLRAYTATDIYLDEAAHFLNDEPVMRVIQPMLIATQGPLTIISTPFGKRGLFWDYYQRIANMQTLDATVKVYDLCPSTISPIINTTDLEREKQMLTDLEFRQEYLGEFIEEVDVYFPIDLITPCVNPALEPFVRAQPGKSFYYGIDFAKQRDETAVIVLEKAKLPDGSTKLIVRQWFTWARMDYSDQIGRLSQLNRILHCQKCKADQTGVGEAIIENLKQAIPTAEGVLFSAPTKIDLAGRLRATLEQRRLEIPNDPKLIMQINSLRYEISKSGNLLFKAEDKNRIHDDYLWALCLAVSAASEYELVIKPLFD